MMKLRKGKKLTEFGGFGVDRHLHDTWNAPDVFWSAAGNSYVVARLREPQRLTGAITQPGFVLLSINGIGEIRWSWAIPLPEWVQGEARDAVNYFLKEVPNDAQEMAST